MGKGSRRGHREPVRREERVDPTPETLAKLESDPLEAMVRVKLVNSAAVDAAVEIKEIYMAVCRQAWCKRGALGKEFGSPSGRTVYEMPGDLAYFHAKTYLPWVRDQGHLVVDATLTLVVDRQNIESQFVPSVARALADYARRVTRRPPFKKYD